MGYVCHKIIFLFILLLLLARNEIKTITKQNNFSFSMKRFDYTNLSKL